MRNLSLRRAWQKWRWRCGGKMMDFSYAHYFPPFRPPSDISLALASPPPLPARPFVRLALLFNLVSVPKRSLSPDTSAESAKVTAQLFSHIEVRDPVLTFNTVANDPHLGHLPVPLSGNNIIASALSRVEHGIGPSISRLWP